MTSDIKRTIKLYCPSVSDVVKCCSCDLSSRIDLGSIAAAFGVEPQSLRLNGHFISRGLDLIASSLTWNSLLSFFSSRGFPTGLPASAPLLVNAKLSRPASKRVHVPENSEISAMNTKGCGFDRLDTKTQAVDGDVVNAKRLKDNSGEDNQINSSLKRRSLPEDQNSLKRTKTNGTTSGEDNQINLSLKRTLPPWDQNLWKKTRTNGTNSVASRRNVDLSSNNNDAKGSGELSCSFIGQNMKRARADEMLLAGPCKRLR